MKNNFRNINAILKGIIELFIMGIMLLICCCGGLAGE